MLDSRPPAPTFYGRSRAVLRFPRFIPRHAFHRIESSVNPALNPVIHAVRWSVLAVLALVLPASAQTGQPVTFVLDAFHPEGTRGFSYSSGQIGSVWKNWFGSAFQSVSWDAAEDADGDPASGSLKIVSTFTGSGSNQFTVFNGFNGIVPSVSAVQFTKVECDVKFAPDSATHSLGGVPCFGRVELGMPTPTFGQKYFGGVNVPATAAGWTHISFDLDPATDPLLLNINSLFVHIWGGTTLSGPSTMWVDNLKFTGTTVSGTATVNYADVRQRIDGFGASSAWASTWSTAEADLFFSTGPNGIGLSLLRSRITPEGTTWETGLMQMAQDRGARIWSAPWSPPVAYKDSGTVNGGNFVSSAANYQNYASQLANYVANMKTSSGVNLHAVSVQNEPDASVSYESCVWTPQQIHDFLPYLANALEARGVGGTKILLPEGMHWEFSKAVDAMNDPATVRQVGILGGHNYGSSPAPVTQFGTPVPKPLWQTEHFIDPQNPAANGLELAREIHDFMTIAEVNAYHYWWLRSSGTGSLAGDSTASPAKRLYVMGNYSKFVRPGFHRVGVSNNTTALVTAYKDPEDNNFVIVAANPTEWPVTQTFDLTNCPAVTSLNQWVTSGSLSLASQPPVAVSAGSFTYELPAYSVVTFSPGNGPRPVVALKTNDANNKSSFNSLENWNDTVAPSPAKDYTASRYILRTPVASGNHSFAGHSLAIPPQAILRFKGANNSTVTIPRLNLDGGSVENGNANTAFTLAGKISVNANSVISPSGDASRSILVSADLSGDGDLVNGNGGPGTVTYSGNNQGFTGAMIVNGGCILRAASQGNLGGDPAYPEPGQLTLDNGVLEPSAGFTMNLPNGGVTLGGGGGSLNVGSGLSLTVDVPLTGPGSLTKSGTGALVCSGTDDHAGATTVSAGSLATEGISGTGAVTVSSGAVLVSSGDIAGPTTIHGTFVPSASISLPGGLTLGTTGKTRWQLAANSLASAPRITAGQVVGNSGAKLDVVLNPDGGSVDFENAFWRVSRSFPVIAASAMSGTFTLGTVTADASGNQAAGFGSFSLQHAADGLSLLWTPLPTVPPPLVTLTNPPAGPVSIPDSSLSLRVTASVTGGEGTLMAWSQVSGPGTAVFDNPAAWDTLVSFPADGTYVLRCTATNVGGSSHQDFTVLVAPSGSLALREGVATYSHPGTFIRADIPTINSGVRDQIIVGRNNAALRGLLAFDVSQIPAGATIHSVTLDLWSVAAGSGTSLNTLELHKLLTNFVEGTGDGTSTTNGAGTGADWPTRTGSSADPWTTAGGAAGTDYETAPLATLAGFDPSTAPVGSQYTFGSTPALVAAVNAVAGTATPLGLMLKMVNDTTGGSAFARFGSDDHATLAQRPLLTISYSVNPTPALATGTAPAAQTGVAATLNGSTTNATSSIWSLVSGPGTAGFDNAAQATTNVTFSHPGAYLLRLAAANAFGETSSTLAVNVQDLTPPAITVPSNMTVEATSAAGAAVTFSTSAVDAVDGALPTTNTPASGSTFPLGTTTVTASAADAAGNSASESFTVTVTPAPDPYAAWAAGQFTAEELADPEISGPNAMPAGDGLSNLLKYALGLAPKTPSTTGITLLEASGTWFFTYRRPANRPDLRYQVEIAPDLTTGSWTTSGVTHQRVSAGDPETWQGSCKPAAAGGIFLRLSVSSP
jgi:glucuronoarabinoxylan endo-1,4-beta-xylanase